MKSTTNGKLNPLNDCWINIPNAGRIVMRSLPELSDGKQASYNSETIMGRSFPLYTYSHSGDRSISLQIHFFLLEEADAVNNINDLRKIQSLVYPREGTQGAPYMPPAICTMSCGKLLADEPLCVVLQSYNVKFPTEVAWFEGKDGLYCPYRFDVDTSWLTVYTSSDLPYASRIISSGR